MDNAGTDAQIVMTVFGSEGTTSEITLEKGEERYVLLKTFDWISALDLVCLCYFKLNIQIAFQNYS